jgi:hypothetical protein
VLADGFSMFSLVEFHFRLAVCWTWLDPLPFLMLHICSTATSVRTILPALTLPRSSGSLRDPLRSPRLGSIGRGRSFGSDCTVRMIQSRRKKTERGTRPPNDGVGGASFQEPEGLRSPLSERDNFDLH